MRVTANMSADNSIYNIQQSRNRLDRLQETITSGQNVNRPSDDPISSRLLLDIGDKMKSFDQYNANISKAKSWMQFNDTALGGINDILLQARKLIGSFNGGSSNPTERQNAHDQLLDLKKAVVDMANTQFGEQYIFGGANNTVIPFRLMTGDVVTGSPTIAIADTSNLKIGMMISGPGIPQNSKITAVAAGSVTLDQNATASATASSLNVYAGDGTEREIEIAPNTLQRISVSGDRLMMGVGSNPSYGVTDILKAFDDLMIGVGDNNPLNTSNVPMITAATKSLDDASRQVFNAINVNLSRMTRVDNMSKLNENNKNTLSSIIGQIQNPDMVKLGVQLNTEKNAFEASLSATAKLVQMSLLDYL